MTNKQGRPRVHAMKCEHLLIDVTHADTLTYSTNSGQHRHRQTRVKCCRVIVVHWESVERQDGMDAVSE